MTDILTGTPPELTYLHPLVREAWTVVWAVASGVLVLILGWMGLSLIMQHHLGQTQNGWREMVPAPYRTGVLPKDFVQRLNRLKKAGGLTWNGFARALRVDKKQMPRWRSGRRIRRPSA